MTLAVLRRLSAFIILFAACAGAHAQTFRAYLSVHGDDLHPCSLLLPCRTLPAALNAVQEGGDVWILDSGTFNTGTVDVSKNLVTIMAAPGATGVIVATAGAPAIRMWGLSSLKLRNITIATDSTNPGTTGIDMNGGTSLSIERSTLDISTASVAIVALGADRLSVVNTTFRGVPGGQAIVAGPNSRVDVSDSRFHRVGWAVFARNDQGGFTTQVAITRCVFSDVDIGVLALSVAAGAAVNVAIVGSTFTQGGYGVMADSSAGGPSVVTVSSSQFTGHSGAGLYNTDRAGAAIEAMRSNTVRGNAADTLGTITTVLPM